MKHQKTRKCLKAYWLTGQSVYTLKGDTFSAVSQDGDNWYRNGTNEHEESLEFCEADVLLVGGARDGIVVG